MLESSARPAADRWRRAEQLAWVAGLVVLAAWAAIGAAGRVGTRRALNEFNAARAATATATAAATVPAVPDLHLWSPVRVRAWQDTQRQPAPAPLAVLRIPRIGVNVPVLEGTDEWTLNRAAGHIEDTARPGTNGNVGIAAHRDGFFRALKDIRTGDALELDTLQGTDAYVVERTWIVEPDDVSVLDPTPSPAVTLVSCYPFYFVGSAPQRFIVRAARVGPKATRH